MSTKLNLHGCSYSQNHSPILLQSLMTNSPHTSLHVLAMQCKSTSNIYLFVFDIISYKKCLWDTDLASRVYVKGNLKNEHQAFIEDLNTFQSPFVHHKTTMFPVYFCQSRNYCECFN